MKEREIDENKRGPFDEEIRKSIERHEKRIKTFENRRPDEEAYDSSELAGWLELGAWTPKEAVCLICDIDPTGADISWAGYDNYAGVFVPKPKINNVGFLREDGDLYVVPRRLQLKGRKVTSEFDSGDDTIDYKNYRISLAEPVLQRTMRLLERGKNFASSARMPPSYFIDWARRKNIEIP